MTPIQDIPTRPQILQPPDSIEWTLDFSRFLNNAGPQVMLLGPNGQQESIPLGVLQALQMVTQTMSRHQAITVTPVDQCLTTQEAADFLGMSCPALIKLLGKHKIPYEKFPGSRHCWILLKDLLVHQEDLRAKREVLFRTMVEDAEDDGLYDLDEPLLRSYYQEQFATLGFRAVLDVCALLLIARADLLLRPAEQGLYVPLWSNRIMVELNRALPRSERATVNRAVRRWACMMEVLPDALADNWESLVDGTIGIPDEDDRHVAVVAIERRVSAIVIDNIRDFPDVTLNPYGSHTVKIDDFLLDLFDIAPGVVMKCLDAMGSFPFSVTSFLREVACRHC